MHWIQTILHAYLLIIWVFPGGSVIKNLPAIQETEEMWVWSLRREDPLEKEMATHSGIPARSVHGQRRLEGYSSLGPKSRMWLSN